LSLEFRDFGEAKCYVYLRVFVWCQGPRYRDLLGFYDFRAFLRILGLEAAGCRNLVNARDPHSQDESTNHFYFCINLSSVTGTYGLVYIPLEKRNDYY
jgi:hypothetical protein